MYMYEEERKIHHKTKTFIQKIGVKEHKNEKMTRNYRYMYWERNNCVL